MNTRDWLESAAQELEKKTDAWRRAHVLFLAGELEAGKRACEQAWLDAEHEQAIYDALEGRSAEFAQLRNELTALNKPIRWYTNIARRERQVRDFAQRVWEWRNVLDAVEGYQEARDLALKVLEIGYEQELKGLEIGYEQKNKSYELEIERLKAKKQWMTAVVQLAQRLNVLEQTPAGNPTADVQLAQRLNVLEQTPDGGLDTYVLTRRGNWKVLQALGAGLSNDEIAKKTGLKKTTVEKEVSKLYKIFLPALTGLKGIERREQLEEIVNRGGILEVRKVNS